MIKHKSGRYLLSKITRYMNGRIPLISEDLKPVRLFTHQYTVTIKLNITELMHTTVYVKIY